MRKGKFIERRELISYLYECPKCKKRTRINAPLPTTKTCWYCKEVFEVEDQN